jgi:hypothetical protein
MQITLPLCLHVENPAIVFHVPAGTSLLTVPRPAPPLANPNKYHCPGPPGPTRGTAVGPGVSRLDFMVQQAIQRTLAGWQQRLGRMPRLGASVIGRTLCLA